jgi:hypothetical protein
VHVALVIDDERLYREHGAINRLSVALMAEGVQLTRIVPDTLLDIEPRYEQVMGLARRFGVPFHVLPWMRRARCASIVEDLEKTPVEVVHVIGERGWTLGLDVGTAFDCPVSIELDKGSQVLRVPRGRGGRNVAAYIAPTMPIAEAMQLRVDSDLVSYVPTGVAIPPRPRRVFENVSESIAITILGKATDLAVYRAMLDALARLTKRYPQLQLFLELPSKRSHEIWRHAQRVGLLPRLSAISHAADHRALITRCDLALLPESGGAVRTVCLELVARGVPVIGTSDPWLDFLIEGETAAIVGGLDVDEWDGRIGTLIEHPEMARAHGLRARDWMMANRPSSAQAARLVTTLTRSVSGTALPFETAV